MTNCKYSSMPWIEYTATISNLLNIISVSNKELKEIEINASFKYLIECAVTCRENDGEIIFIGNGASAAMASHSAADIFKNGKIRTRVLTDCALITAIGNDISYEQVYATPLAMTMREKDILVAISSSGSSKNIIEAVKVAHKAKGKIITLSAFHENNPLRQMGDLNFYVPAQTYGFAETCHASLLHYWTDTIISNS